MIAVILAATIAIALSARTRTGRRFWGGQLLDPNLDQFNRSTFFTGDPTGVSPWTRAPVVHRMAVRYGAITLLLLGILSAITHPVATAALCITALILIAAWWTRNSWHWVTTFKLRKQVINPLFHGLRQTIGWADGIKPTDVILTTNNYQHDGVTIYPPETFQRLDTPIEHTETIASRTLGGEWEANWELTGEPSLQLHHAPPPPDEVTWDELEHYLAAIEPSQLLLGLGTRSAPFSINLDTEVPHILLSVPTGGGKSVTVALLGCQVLHHGGELVIIDLDMATNWIKDGDQLLPGVTYCRTVEEAHAKLVELGNIQEARNTAADRDPNYAPHRILTVIEEANRTGEALAAYWTDLKQKGNSPALRALRGLTQGGRKRRMHVLAVPQRADANIFGPTGGGAAIENFPLRIIGAEASERTWENNAPQIKHRPPIIRHKGRVHVVDGNDYRTVQVGYLTDEQARAWATSGAEPVSVTAGEEELPGWLQ